MAKIMFPDTAKRSKYGNRKVEYHGWMFHSKLECDYYKHLQILKELGEIHLILRQVPLFLAPGSKLILDFMTVSSKFPNVEFIDTKGVMTAVAKTKIKMAEHLYGIKIKIVKRGDF